MTTLDRLNRSLRRWLPERAHGTTGTAAVIVLALVLGYLAGWVLGDVLSRWWVTAISVLLVGYHLNAAPSRWAILSRFLTVMAGLILAIPLVVWGVYLSSGPGMERPLALIVSTGDRYYLLVFLVIAGILAGLGILVNRVGAE